MIQYKSGQTPLVKVNEFCDRFGLVSLLIKDESQNPCGTWKDRRSELIIKKAKKESVDKLCLITSGNAGFSLAKFAQTSEIKIISIIDHNTPRSIQEALVNSCADVIKLDLSKTILDSEKIISLLQENSTEKVWDVTNGFHDAYELIITEIENEAPNYIICPVGSGEAFIGLANSIEKSKLKTKLIGVTPRSNPSFADKLYRPWTPYNQKIRLILEMGHQMIELTEEEIKSVFSYADKYIECEPSSAVVIAALSKMNFNVDDKIVVINSGKGLTSKINRNE